MKGKKMQEREEKKISIKLVQRDLEIMLFLYDMGVATFESIKEKFFFKSYNGEESTSNFWAHERIQILCKVGLIKKERTLIETVFILTKQGFKILNLKFLDKNFIPIKTEGLTKSDHFFLDHSLQVVRSRIYLEKLGRSFEWFSEKNLYHLQQLTYGLPKKYQPDALYRNRTGDLIAFEMEISKKPIKRYEEKILKYIDLLRSHFDRPLGFRKVLYVCVRESVYEKLNKLTAPYGEHFHVEKFSELETKFLDFKKSQVNVPVGVTMVTPLLIKTQIQQSESL